MLFLTYWELNEKMPVDQRMGIVEHLTSSGLFPPENVNIVRWDSTPDGWGILLAEADNAADISRAVNMWRVAGDGFFTITKTSPVLPVKEAVESTTELLKSLSGLPQKEV